MVTVEQLRLLERAGEVGLAVGDEVPRHWDEGHREKVRAFVVAHRGEDGRVRASYWVDGRTCVLRSRPSLQVLPYESLVSAAGWEVLDLRVFSPEAVFWLRDAGEVGFADELVSGRCAVGDVLVREVGGGTEGAERKALRQSLKVEFFRLVYGMDAEDEGVSDRLLGRWPGLRRPRGTREERGAAVVSRRGRETSLWLRVAEEAERVGCRVSGFWMTEPVVECPAGADAAGARRALEDFAYGLLAS